MQTWLLSIVGIISLGLLLEIVMPEGQTTKYVRGAFSLLVIFVIVSPLPALFKGDIDISLEEIDIDIDDSFVEYTSSQLSDVGENEIEEYLKQCGYDADAKIVYKDNSVTDIVAIEICIKLSVLEKENANTYIENVKGLLIEKTELNEDVFLIWVEDK